MAAEPEEIAKRAEDHFGVAARRAAGRARVVGDRNFLHAIALAAGLHEKLRAEGRAPRVHAHILPDLAAEELERAVDVARRVAEERGDEQLPADGIEDADGRVPPGTTVADDQIGVLH